MVRESPGRAERVLGSGRSPGERTAGRSPVDLHVTVRAPGRVNLIGEHTDYSGGLAMPAAIQLALTVTGESVPDEIALVSTRYGSAESFPPDGGGPPLQGWGRYAQAVARELDALGRPAVGLAATISSDLPPEAGLSSSAALEVGIALALCEVARFRPASLELARACARAEERAVGVPCGLLDQVACMLGRTGSAILLDCATLDHREVPLPSELVLLVIDSGRPRALASSGYATRRAELARALAQAGVTRSSDLDEAALDRVEQRLRPRLRHVFTENARVEAFADALQCCDLAAAGRLVSASHASLRDDYEVSTPELDSVVELAERAGAYGARLVGGGFGGSVLALAAEPLAGRVTEALEAYGARTLAVQAANGARVLGST